MSKPDPLQAFFDAGEAPRFDPAFTSRVAQSVATRRLRLELLSRLAAGALVALAFALIAPALGQVIAVLVAGLEPVTMALAVAGLIAWAGHQVLTRPIRVPRLRLF
jgi:hypothetical protein